MKGKIKNCLFFFFALVTFNLILAQEQKTQSADDLMKDSIYKANKTKVLNYSMKDFEKLFFEFTEKKFDPNILLTKEEFYTYTVKIATFSDRLAS